MYVNNEIGAVEPIAEAVKLVKAKNPNTLFHVDAIQAYGKYIIYPKRLGIDMMSVSGHKIHGPKGIGFLYVKEKTKLKPIIYGGGQQRGMRSGTENVAGIAGLGQAAKEIYEQFEHKQNYLYQLKETFIAGALVAKYNNRVNIIVSGIDTNYKQFNANYFLHYKILEYYKKEFKFVDLNGITGDFSKSNPYKGLNDFKLGFNPNAYEFIGEFDFIINEKAYYSLYKKNLLAKEFNHN